MTELKEGSRRYKALLDEALDLHIRKNTGYAADNPDAFSNFRLATGMGLTPVQGVMVRLGDKFARAQSLFKNPENDKVGEGLRDTLMDLSAYALIAICLIEEDLERAMRETGTEITQARLPRKPIDHDPDTCEYCFLDGDGGAGEPVDPRDWFDPDVDEPLPSSVAPKFKRGTYVTCRKPDGEKPHRYNPDEPCVDPVLAEAC